MYDINDIRKSHEMFYYLLEHHSIKESSESSMYREFVSSDDLQFLVNDQAEASGCSIARFGGAIYLIPDLDNKFLGYSKAQLKKELCRGNATDKDFYLVQFAIMVFLLEFYDGKGSSSRTRLFIRIGELQDSISKHLREGAEMPEEEQEENGLLFSQMLEVYEALRSDENGSRKKTTKEGLLHHMLRFMQAHGLVEYIEQDEMIRPTRKLDHFMDFNLLNAGNYQRVISILEGFDEQT